MSKVEHPPPTPQTDRLEKEHPKLYTPVELANLRTVEQYMTLAYSPKYATEENVDPYCAENATFEAKTTFPASKTPQEYAKDHFHVMQSVNDLSIDSYDFFIAKGNQVALRYSASGSHSGKDFVTPDSHRTFKASGKRAHWTAAALFNLDSNHKITHWYKDWDKLNMFSQLGWSEIGPQDLM